MKIRFFILLIMLSVYFITDAADRGLVVKVISASSTRIKQADIYYYNFDIELYNKSDTAISFWIYTCSWQFNFLSDAEDMYFGPLDCDHNFPELKKILPGQKIKYFTPSRYTIPLNNVKKKRFRVGFIWVKEKEIKNEDCFDDLLSKKLKLRKDIIWSNPVKLPKKNQMLKKCFCSAKTATAFNTSYHSLAIEPRFLPAVYSLQQMNESEKPIAKRFDNGRG